LSIGQSQTELRHVERAWQRIRDEADKLSTTGDEGR